MKIPFSIKLPALIFSALLLIVAACSKDDDKEPTFAAPTVIVAKPVIPAGGVTVEIGQTLNVKLFVAADAGLKEVTANDVSVKTYGGTEVSDSVTYQIAPTTAGPFSVKFVVIDSKSKKDSVVFDYTSIVPPTPPYVLASLNGALLSSTESDVESWDVRTVFGFANTSDLGTSTTTVQFVASNGDAAAATDPTVAGAKVLSIVPHAKFWGSHYVYGMISLGKVVPSDELKDLPQMTFGSITDVNGKHQTKATVTAGYKRVIQVDAYYDGTVTDSVSITNIKKLAPIFGLDLSKGYQIDLLLAKSNPHVTTGGGEITGIYTAYSAWITDANKWQTLTFEIAADGEARWLNDGDGPNDETRTFPASIEEVDVATIVPAFSQSLYDYDTDKTIRNAIDGDYNRLYFKNLRIVNAK